MVQRLTRWPKDGQISLHSWDMMVYAVCGLMKVSTLSPMIERASNGANSIVTSKARSPGLVALYPVSATTVTSTFDDKGSIHKKSTLNGNLIDECQLNQAFFCSPENKSCITDREIRFDRKPKMWVDRSHGYPYTLFCYMYTRSYFLRFGLA